MRTPFLVANSVACLLVYGLAQDKSDGIDADLRSAIATWASAIDSGDADTIALYALDDAVFVSPSGVALTKQARLDQIRKAKPRLASGSSEHRYQRFGDTLIENRIAVSRHAVTIGCFVTSRATSKIRCRMRCRINAFRAD
jgi:hypothetical protein